MAKTFPASTGDLWGAGEDTRTPCTNGTFRIPCSHCRGDLPTQRSLFPSAAGRLCPPPARNLGQCDKHTVSHGSGQRQDEHPAAFCLGLMSRGCFDVVSPWPGLQIAPGCISGLLQGLPKAPLQMCNGSVSLVLPTGALGAAPPQSSSPKARGDSGRSDTCKRSTSRTRTPRSFSSGCYSCGTAPRASPAPPGTGMSPAARGAASLWIHSQGGRQTAEVLLERRDQLSPPQSSF